jgi:hypothetical protein
MRKRSTAVLVIAICHFVLGGIGLSCGVCSGVLGATGLGMEFAKGFNPGAERQAEKAKANERLKAERVPGFRFEKSFETAMDWVSSIALVAAGFGLLYMKPWGHWLSTGYAFSRILLCIVFFFYQLEYLAPVEAEILRNNPLPGMNPQQAEIAEYSAEAGAAIGPCILMVYPVVVLVIMLLPSTLAAFSRGRRAEGPSPDDD